MPFSFDSFAGVIPGSPVQILQVFIVLFAILLVYLLLFTLRDILLRTKSFWYQFFCVLLVGCLPLAGFLVYLLIRPARTVKQREVDAMLRRLTGDEEIEDVEDLEDVEDSSESLDS